MRFLLKIVFLIVITLLIATTGLTLRFVTFTEYFFNDDFYPVIQGWTDSSSTNIAVIYNKKYPIALKVSEEGVDSHNNLPFLAEDFSWGESEWKVKNLSINNLKPETIYKLKITGKQRNEEREFSTLNLNKRTGRILFGSCINKNFNTPEIWKSLEEQKPEAVLFLGDQTYADKSYIFERQTASPEQIWQSYMATLHSVNYFSMQRLIPTMAVWDDHDYGQDNSDSTFPYKSESLQIARKLFPITKDLEGPGDSSYFKLFGLNIFLLDDRSFRSQISDNSLNTGVMFGDQQLEWLKAKLDHTTGPVMIANGGVFWGAYNPDEESYEKYFPSDLNKFTNILAKYKFPVFFASGDLHYSEAMSIESSKLGYSTFEFVSSAFHSNVFPNQDRNYQNKRRILSIAEYNFLILNFSISENSFKGLISSWGIENKNYFNLPFKYTWDKHKITLENSN